MPADALGLSLAKASARVDLAVLAAGLAAERAAGLPLPEGDGEEDGGIGDRESAASLAAAFFSEDPGGVLEWADRTATNIFADPASLAFTRALATALVDAAHAEEADLEGDALDAILQRAEGVAPMPYGGGLALIEALHPMPSSG